jgi:hypothetical protein
MEEMRNKLNIFVEKPELEPRCKTEDEIERKGVECIYFYEDTFQW